MFIKKIYVIIKFMNRRMYMNNGMNKEELLKLINSLKIDKEEFWILSSGSLVLREIYEIAHDLDIAVTFKGLFINLI